MLLRESLQGARDELRFELGDLESCLIKLLYCFFGYDESISGRF